MSAAETPAGHASDTSVTPDTVVAVTMLGAKHSFTFAKPASLRRMANTLEDLTGYRAEHIIDTVVTRLGQAGYGTELSTSAGALCPIRFLITVHGARRPESAEVTP